MATYASTIIIEGIKFNSDAALLKKLNLGKKLRTSDQHKIGKANVHYHDALNTNNEVFVSTLENHTLICSDYIPSDFVGGFSTLKSGVFNLFPEGKKVVFFSNSTSMLNGFIIFDGQKTIRTKVVQDGKLEKIAGDDLDFGDLLELEKTYYEKEDNIKNSYDYLWGLHDLEIAYKYIEAHFGITDIESKLDHVVCNKYSRDEISTRDISKANQGKIDIKKIHRTTDNFIKSVFDNLTKVKRKDNFPSVSRLDIYTTDLNHNLLSLHNKTNFRPPSGTNSDLTVFLKPNQDFEQIQHFSFVNEEYGWTLFNANAHEVLIANQDYNERIVSPDDLEYFANTLSLEKDFIHQLLFESAEKIFSENKGYFLNVFELVESHSNKKGWLQGYSKIYILMARIYFEHKNNLDLLITKKLTHFFNNYEATTEYFKPRTAKKITKYLEEINEFKRLFPNSE